LRVVLHPHEAVYEVIVDQDDARVEVLVLVCDDGEAAGEPMDCPVHVYLERPLGARMVVDRARDGALVEEYVPRWGEGVP
jgi:hypothetical protein